MSWLSRIRSGHAGHGGGQVSRGERTPSPPTTPGAAIDPVSGEAVRTDRAVTSLYEGKIYYFASRESRERFEAAPQQYAHNAEGHAVAPSEPSQHRARRRGGC